MVFIQFYVFQVRVWIWIDVICINQFDNDEKVVQVWFMSLVYFFVKNVLIWFGFELDGGVFQIIRILVVMYWDLIDEGYINIEIIIDWEDFQFEE